jgi:hypothetical protein
MNSVEECAASILDLRAALKKSSLFPQGVVAVLLRVTKQRLNDLIRDGHVERSPFAGAGFVCVRSALNYAKARYRRRLLGSKKQLRKPARGLT